MLLYTMNCQDMSNLLVLLAIRLNEPKTDQQKTHKIFRFSLELAQNETEKQSKNEKTPVTKLRDVRFGFQINVFLVIKTSLLFSYCSCLVSFATVF